MAVALTDKMHNVYLEKARQRILANPQDELLDIIDAMNREHLMIEARCRNNILRTWFIGSLFNYDYEAARRALVKCITLNPAKAVSTKEANKLLVVLWQSCQLLFHDDFSVLFDEIERVIDTNKAFEDEDNLPFV